MRINYFTYGLLTLFVFVSMLVSCKKSETSTTLASETKLTGIVFAKNDSFPGIEKASFTIILEDDTSLVYNIDSLPCGTKLDSVIATFYFSTNIGYAMFKSDSAEKLISVSDTLNFNPRPCRLRVVSEDQKNERFYHIYVNVHQVDPDLYVWTQTQTSLYTGSCDVHAENFGGQILLYTQDGINVRLYTSATGAVWSAPQTVIGLPSGTDVRHIVQGLFGLYYAQGNTLYASTDGLVWIPTDCSATGLTLHNLLFSYNDSIWAVVSDAADDLWLATFAEGEIPAKQTQIGPLENYYRSAGERFPVSDFSAISFVGKSGRLRAMIMGGFDVDGNALNSRWNLEWIDTDIDKGCYRLENFTIEQPDFAELTGTSLVWYDERMLLFGSTDADNTIIEYPVLESRDEGMNWYVPDSAQNMLPPTYVPRQRTTAVITDESAILLIGGQTRTTTFSDVWRGKKNSIDWQ